LSIDAVTIESGTALVDLTARALVAGRSDRSLMKAQLEATLRQLPNVQKVAISIERSRQEIADTQLDLLVDDQAPLVALTASGLEVLAGSEPAVNQGGLDFFAQSEANQIALSRASGWLAVSSPSGVYRTRYDQVGNLVELVDSRLGLLAPVYDRQQYLWTMGRVRGSEIIAHSLNGQKRVIGATWLQDQSVRSFDLSAEGSRAIFLVQSDGRSRVLVASVVRDRTGAPISLGDPIEIGTEASEPLSVHFLDELTVSILNQGLETKNAYLITLGGMIRSVPVPSDALNLIAVGNNQLLYLLSEQGNLYSYRGLTWSLIRDGVRAITIAH
jgi:hypothetical protein